MLQTEGVGDLPDHLLPIVGAPVLEEVHPDAAAHLPVQGHQRAVQRGCRMIAALGDEGPQVV